MAQKFKLGITVPNRNCRRDITLMIRFAVIMAKADMDNCVSDLPLHMQPGLHRCRSNANTVFGHDEISAANTEPPSRQIQWPSQRASFQR